MGALVFADFAGSCTNLSCQEVLSLHAWLEVRQPNHFIFTGIVRFDDSAAVVAARALAAAFVDKYDLFIGVFRSDPPSLESLDGATLDVDYPMQHASRCWGADRRFFDIRASLDGEHRDDVLHL